MPASRRPPPPSRQPLSPRSGVVRHSDVVVALEHALERLPASERVEVVLEHSATGVASRTSWNRVAVCVALRKGAQRYGVYETVGRARKDGFGLVTRHPTDDALFLFIDTKPLPAPAAEEVTP